MQAKGLEVTATDYPFGQEIFSWRHQLRGGNSPTLRVTRYVLENFPAFALLYHLEVLKYLVRSKLVIADLSFHNPNVFYELAIRHMTGLPTVHLIRKGDQIPFDLKDFRTIVIDTTDKYELVASLDTCRAEIANHVRTAAASGGEGSNPVRTFCKELRVEIIK